MKNQHAKSACLGGSVIRFGKRRRQCTKCDSTWRVRRKKRGRKRRRSNHQLIRNFLDHRIATLRALAEWRGVAPSTMQERVRNMLNQFLHHTPWPVLPPRGPLILIADARVKYIAGYGWLTTHFLFLRPVETVEAMILPPFWRRGTEVVAGWRDAMDTLSPEVKQRIVALVCDGHNGLVSEARWQGWILQRCHFHLLKRIQSRRSRFRIARHKQEADTIFSHARRVLESPLGTDLVPSLNTLEEIGWTSSSPEIRKVLSGFVRNFEDYRAYLKHPQLRLPATNNTAESFNQRVQELVHRARGFRSVTSLKHWIEALIKHKKKIKCNGARQPN